MNQFQNKEYNLVGARAALKSVRFWQYFAMMVLANVFGGYFSYVYKPIGVAAKIDDFLLSWAASASSVVQAITRLTCGGLYDKLGFKKIFIFLMTVCTLNSLVCYYARNVEWLYFICI